jgi:rhodanese-related sulfurtransferase
MSQATTTRVIDVDGPMVKSWLDAGKAMLIDVREPDEYAADRIPGAALMPLSKFDPARVKADEGRTVVLHCRSGARAQRAAAALLSAGWPCVHVMAGGIMAWKEAGLATERDAGAPIAIIRQVQITAGSLVLLGLALGWFVSPWFLLLSAFIGAGLVAAGITDTCGLAMLLAKMPWNRRAPR